MYNLVYFEMKIKSFAIWIPLTIFSVYIAFLTIFAYIGEKSNEGGNFEISINCGTIIDKITISDNSGKIITFNGYMNNYSLTGEKGSFEKGMYILEEGVNVNNRLNYIYKTLASIYEKSGELDKAFDYYDKYLELRRYDYETYAHYYRLLMAQKSKDIKYEEKALKILSEYNQIKDTMDEKTVKVFFELPQIIQSR